MVIHPTSGEWTTRGSSQIYACDKMIGMVAVKDVTDLNERMSNLKVMADGKDLLDALEKILLTSSASIRSEDESCHTKKYYEERDKAYALINKLKQ